MVNRSVIVLANDVTPGCGLPVAAPGLRAFGLAAGLGDHGFEVTTIIPAELLETLWRQPTPPPLQPGTIALPEGAIGDFIATRAPVTVIMTNSNQVEHLQRSDEVRYVLDFFAPKMLEAAYQYGEEYREGSLQWLRNRKLAAFELADAVAINGAKKVPYVLAWLLQVKRDPRAVPTAVVTMGVPGSPHRPAVDGPLRLGLAGYLQGWSLPGAWLDVVRRKLETRGDLTLDVLLPSHWGHGNEELRSPAVDALTGLDNVTNHPVMRFGEFQDFMSGVDAAIDLFDWSLEREYAMVTRTVVALACGVPVVHPPFTEVAPFIERYDAGWLIDAADLDGLAGFLDGLTRSEAARKSENATRLWSEVFEPRVATAPLTGLIEKAWARE